MWASCILAGESGWRWPVAHGGLPAVASGGGDFFYFLCYCLNGSFPGL